MRREGEKITGGYMQAEAILGIPRFLLTHRAMTLVESRADVAILLLVIGDRVVEGLRPSRPSRHDEKPVNGSGTIHSGSDAVDLDHKSR